MSALTSGLDVANFPKVLKPILPFLQRANDFEKRAPLVAFYCRTYAAQLGITIIQSATTKEDEPTKMLIDLMDKLETDKQQLNANTEEGRATVELFALKMFKKADDADRAGRHDAIVARLFYASSVLMEVTKQFGDLTEDILEKQKYARWKAAEISRGIKTGAPIVSGPFGSEEGNGSTGYDGEQESEAEQNEEHQNEMNQRQQFLRHTSNEIQQEQDQYSYNQNQYQDQGYDNNSYNQNNQYSNNQYNQYQQPQQDEQMYDNQQYNNYYQQQPPVQPQQPVQPVQPQQPVQRPPSQNLSKAVPPPQQNTPAPQQPRQVSPMSPPQQQQPKPQQQPQQQPKPAPQPVKQQTVSVQQTFQIEKEEIPLEDVMKAQKFTKFAMSSLQFNDVETAKKYLRDALQLIGGL